MFLFMALIYQISQKKICQDLKCKPYIQGVWLPVPRTECCGNSCVQKQQKAGISPFSRELAVLEIRSSPSRATHTCCTPTICLSVCYHICLFKKTVDIPVENRKPHSWVKLEPLNPMTRRFKIYGEVTSHSKMTAGRLHI